MASDTPSEGSPEPSAEPDAVQHLRGALEAGRDWPAALLEAAAMWTVSQDTYQGVHRSYFIGGEAFDLQLLAERLCQAVDGLIPEEEKEALLLAGQFPNSFDETQFQGLLGVDKYRGYLNYFYGVTVEEALQLAEEAGAQKRQLSRGNAYQEDFSDEAFVRIYHAPKSELLSEFREERGYPARRSTTVAEAKEFTYWLFKRRLKTSDRAKLASDTRKGLEQLQRMRAASRPPANPRR